MPVLAPHRTEGCRRSSYSSLVRYCVCARGFLSGPKVWHLSELALLFLTQAAMEMESRGMLVLLLLSLCLGQEAPEMGPLTGFWVLGLGFIG